MFHPFPSIDQFRNVIRGVGLKATYVGRDEAGDPIYDGTRPKPTLTFRGTVKVHGTNAAIVITPDGAGGLTVGAQSRSQELVAPADNAGFRAWVEATITPDLARDLYHQARATEGTEVVVVYGEWAGKGIQAGVAVNALEKFFYVFAVKVITRVTEVTDERSWIDIGHTPVTRFHSPSHRIFNATHFQTHTLEIDFSAPEQAQNQLVALTEAVEAKCPVGAAFGVEGVGEGVVWECVTPGYEGLRFKVKGEKHSVSRGDRSV